MEKDERRAKKSKLRKIELMVWIIILIICSTVGMILYIRHEKSFETHSIYMPDVDGLIVGSPVHFMGIHVGHVTQTKIINENEIKVSFRITNKSIHIPKGTYATVEFSGLGGSKSLEIYSADMDKTPNELVGKNDYILVDRPKRLRDSMALLYEMYKTLMNMIYTSTNFGRSLDSIEAPIKKSKPNIDMNKLLKQSDEYLDYYDSSMKSIRKILKK